MNFTPELRVRRAQTFDEIAELYDRGRREPPAWIYETLFAKTGFEPSAARVVEIGCGTGKSTLPLARRGASVTALEMGANLAAVARRNLAAYPRVEVVETRFEDWRPAEEFDLALAITSWHWLDPAVRYERAAGALRDGGVLAFTLDGQAYPPGFDPFFVEIQDAYEVVGMGRIPEPRPLPESVADAREEMERSGCFREVRVLRHLWSEEFTADEHVAMMETASDHRLLDAEKREWLFGEMRRLIGGRRIRKDNLTILHLAWR
ncbi:MAG: class I SAM-dependent methyltransferase [Acidobacteriota bacterium]